MTTKQHIYSVYAHYFFYKVENKTIVIYFNIIYLKTIGYLYLLY